MHALQVSCHSQSNLVNQLARLKIWGNGIHHDSDCSVSGKVNKASLINSDESEQTRKPSANKTRSFERDRNICRQ